jgi:hypothetical protein
MRVLVPLTVILFTNCAGLTATAPYERSEPAGFAVHVHDKIGRVACCGRVDESSVLKPGGATWQQ